ncbi:hypothetical protein [Paracidovorax valerianellae]|uniref:hypothetical protein n=1 Tax=Paracidovorax valerianellae TaxID=187868 RepID=UPI00230493BE|nr:hypothetical protein [Paracidovorax valerianellae]MDA8444770.1 hypothetical protein [Paracidovorax valerianellae]UYL85422.1 hypothetical protein gp20 [Acidovorax phage Alfacinha3]UYL85523.1 hypothetical protein gp20 [Acidovorax phage Alfacinha1]
MTGRDRITVELGEQWRIYQMAALPGWTMLGTVHQGERAGALAKSRTGQLVMMNGGVVRSLDQRKAVPALDAAQAEVLAEKK